MRTGYRFAALLILSVACAELAAGCARPEAMRARDYFGEDIDFGFVTGHLVAAMKELDNKDHAPVCICTAFPIGPAVLVTAGHAFMSPQGRIGDRLLAYGQGRGPKHRGTVKFTDDPNSPWKSGNVIRLARPDQGRGDFALIRFDRALSQWDHVVDPTYRPKPGDIVVVGSRFGREDDRVLTILDQPPHCTACAGRFPRGAAVFGSPALTPGWSGSPVKALRRTGTGSDERTEWVTFGYIIAGGFVGEPSSFFPSHAAIMPLPSDILQYLNLPPGGDDSAQEPPTASQAAAADFPLDFPFRGPRSCTLIRTVLGSENDR